MNTVTKLFRAAWILILSIFFILCGGIASLISGIIEFDVFKNIFAGESKEQLIFCFCIVACFEIIKNFSSLIIPLISNNLADSKEFIKFCKITKKTRIALVAISFVCTIIYTGNSLIQTSMTDEEKNQRIAEINKNYDTEKNKLDDEIDKEFNEIKNNLEKSKEFADTTLSEYLKNHSITSSLGKKYKKEADDATNKLNNFILNGKDTMKNNEPYSSKYSQLNRDKDGQIKELNKENTFISAKSTYLNNFLGIIRIQGEIPYTFTVLLISLIISATLECIIAIASEFLSTRSTDIFKLFDEQLKFDEKEKLSFEKIGKIVVNSSICLAVYITTMLIFKENIANKTLTTAFLAYCISLSVIKLYEKTNRSKNTSSFTEKFLDVIISGAIAFVLYFIMGMFIGDVYTDISSIAVTIGGVVGKLLNMQISFPFPPNDK